MNLLPIPEEGRGIEICEHGLLSLYDFRTLMKFSFLLLKKKKIIIANSTIAERMKSSIIRILRKVDIRQVFKKISVLFNGENDYISMNV